MAGGRRSVSARSRRRRVSECDEYCSKCDNDTCDKTVPLRAVWWIVTIWDAKILMDNIFEFLGLLWLFKPIWDLVFPNAVVLFFVSLLCRFFNILAMLEENVPFFLFCEYMVPLFLIVWFALTSICYGAPTTTYYLVHLNKWVLRGWLLLYTSLGVTAPRAESWWEVLAQLFLYFVVLLSTKSSDKQPLFPEDIDFIKDFGGCECPSQRKYALSEVIDSNVWAFESQVRVGMYEVLPAFHLLQGGVPFDDLPTYYKIKVIEFLQKEMKDGRKRFEYRSPAFYTKTVEPQCSCSCSSSTGANTAEGQLITESSIKHEGYSTEISVKSMEIPHQVQRSDIEEASESSDCSDSTDSHDYPVIIRKTGSQKTTSQKMHVTAAKPPSNLVDEKSNSASANIKTGPESNNENLAKTLSTFKGLEPSNPDPMSKQTTNILNSNDNIKTSICNKDNQEQKPRNNEEFGKSESKSTTKISKSIGGGEKEKKKRGRKCGRRGCPEEGTQLCSRLVYHVQKYRVIIKNFTQHIDISGARRRGTAA